MLVEATRQSPAYQTHVSNISVLRHLDRGLVILRKVKSIPMNINLYHVSNQREIYQFHGLSWCAGSQRCSDFHGWRSLSCRDWKYVEGRDIKRSPLPPPHPPVPRSCWKMLLGIESQRKKKNKIEMHMNLACTHRFCSVINSAVSIIEAASCSLNCWHFWPTVVLEIGGASDGDYMMWTLSQVYAVMHLYVYLHKFAASLIKG